MCQNCVDEGRLSQATFNRIEAFCESWPDAAYGPGHIVLDDDNVYDSNLDWCMGIVEAQLSGDMNHLNDVDQRFMDSMQDVYSTHSKDELNATLEFLRALRKILEVER